MCRDEDFENELARAVRRTDRSRWTPLAMAVPLPRTAGRRRGTSDRPNRIRRVGNHATEVGDHSARGCGAPRAGESSIRLRARRRVGVAVNCWVCGRPIRRWRPAGRREGAARSPQGARGHGDSSAMPRRVGGASAGRVSSSWRPADSFASARREAPLRGGHRRAPRDQPLAGAALARVPRANARRPGGWSSAGASRRSKIHDRGGAGDRWAADPAPGLTRASAYVTPTRGFFGSRRPRG